VFVVFVVALAVPAVNYRALTVLFLARPVGPLWRRRAAGGGHATVGEAQHGIR
jgi:hypothetical protein